MYGRGASRSTVRIPTYDRARARGCRSTTRYGAGRKTQGTRTRARDTDEGRSISGSEGFLHTHHKPLVGADVVAPVSELGAAVCGRGGNAERPSGRYRLLHHTPQLTRGASVFEATEIKEPHLGGHTSLLLPEVVDGKEVVRGRGWRRGRRRACANVWPCVFRGNAERALCVPQQLSRATDSRRVKLAGQVRVSARCVVWRGLACGLACGVLQCGPRHVAGCSRVHGTGAPARQGRGLRAFGATHTRTHRAAEHVHIYRGVRGGTWRKCPPGGGAGRCMEMRLGCSRLGR